VKPQPSYHPVAHEAQDCFQILYHHRHLSPLAHTQIYILKVLQYVFRILFQPIDILFRKANVRFFILETFFEKCICCE
jgi:hypothetical protein